ncbi:phosphohistidine phosphatase [Brachybacterium avium]|uniref:Phosphohistidine phosphatase n=1 Tax=Brachybacterium avium TaxID=2017485 RepID=A0A220U8V4_9MICO|nr:histidine phosphatase family protein [Brachybacterium avium]ASK64568.1 phosphohistidine phosphatase [Brachybacterium avium]
MSSSDPDSRLLLLMRHGKAESGSGRPDHERALADRGVTQAQLVGEYLDAQNVQVSRVLVSDAVRTTQTWEAVAAAMPGFDGEVSFHEEIYSGGAADVLALVHGVDARHPVVMVVGHEPTISTLTSLLATEDSEAGAAAQARIGMPTGATAVLSGPLQGWGSLAEASLTLHTIVRP